MKKSEFKKLKVGDTVTLRTLDELEQLSCWKKGRLFDVHGVVGDDGRFRDHVVSFFPEILGMNGTVTSIEHHEISIRVLSYSLYVVRQHLKGSK